MIRLFCGYDAREAIGFHVFISSVLRRASEPVSIVPLDSKGLPQGANSFTYSRFLVPWLCGFSGHAIFCDASDMVMLADVAELDRLFDERFAVQVVKHANYSTQHRTKYRNTEMQCPNIDYARKNWASVMVINCEHSYWRPLDPGTLGNTASMSLLQFGGLRLNDDPGRVQLREVGELPPEWNRIVDEGQPADGAKLLHWTAGIPAFPFYADAPAADVWRDEQSIRMAIP